MSELYDAAIEVREAIIGLTAEMRGLGETLAEQNKAQQAILERIAESLDVIALTLPDKVTPERSI